MYIIWDKWDNAPFSKSKHGHFTIYGNRKACQRALYAKTSGTRCEVKAVSMVAFEEGGFI